MTKTSHAKMERMLKKFIHEVRTGVRDGSTVSSIADSHVPSEKEAWEEIRRELQSVGITVELFV
ncbi:hypothetical protein N7532_003839 [Penicillium argentinense]|uniref:Uncharacterized protein n=1 Tax=Penicillium argentinense TaxID=1131581 RepID=A0A9W9FNQ4_9EURO|nr:uncharacterized protein N7532_003839 [Penicillium argentinense]KAJ5103310.1 hypothetical protein N7532_003839 [Penicillium argentinense]